MTLPISFIGPEPEETPSPIAHATSVPVGQCPPSAEKNDGEFLLRHFIDSLDDENREQAIAQVVEVRDEALRRYEQDGFFADKGDADRLDGLLAMLAGRAS